MYQIVLLEGVLTIHLRLKPSRQSDLLSCWPLLRSLISLSGTFPCWSRKCIVLPTLAILLQVSRYLVSSWKPQDPSDSVKISNLIFKASFQPLELRRKAWSINLKGSNTKIQIRNLKCRVLGFFFLNLSWSFGGLTCDIGRVGVDNTARNHVILCRFGVMKENCLH